MINAQSWTALFRAFTSHQQPQHIQTKGFPQLPCGQTGQTLVACTPRVPREKNSLFPIKLLPLFEQLRFVQFGPESLGNAFGLDMLRAADES